MSIYDYAGCIKVTFDRPIIVDPEIIIGVEPLPYKANVTDAMLTVSGYYSGRQKIYAVDGLLTTRWQTPSSGIPGWITANFGALQSLFKIRVYTISGQYPTTAFTIQGSNDNSSWVDIANVTILSTYTGWTDTEFAPVSYQYWRLYVTAGTSSYATLYEIEYWPSRVAYRTDGWEVYAQEYNTIPMGEASKKNYSIRKITRSLDNMSVLIWLNLDQRIKYPIGDVTVKFNGTLVGLGNVNVEPFELSFTPTAPEKIFNPNDAENITVAIGTTVYCFDVTYRYGQLIENITVQAGAAIVVTKVGSLPL